MKIIEVEIYIDKEVQDRTVADQVLQNNIDSEATTRAE